MTADESAHPKLSRLRACATELGRALSQANEIPPGLPVQAVRQVVANLLELELEGDETIGDQQVLVHTRAKLREWRRKLRRAASPEESEFFALERARDALVVRRDDPLLTAKLQAFEGRLAELERASREAQREAANAPCVVVALLYVERLNNNIGTLVKLALMTKAELHASLIDLDWLAKPSEQVGELAKSLKEGVDAAAKATTELAKLFAEWSGCAGWRSA